MLVSHVDGMTDFAGDVAFEAEALDTCEVSTFDALELLIIIISVMVVPVVHHLELVLFEVVAECIEVHLLHLGVQLTASEDRVHRRRRAFAAGNGLWRCIHVVDESVDRVANLAGELEEMRSAAMAVGHD